MTEGCREGVSGPSREEVGAPGLCTSQGGGTLGVHLAPSRPLVAAVTGDLGARWLPFQAPSHPLLCALLIPPAVSRWPVPGGSGMV